MGTQAPNPVITRHFATIGGRQVHYRRAGSGPPVLALHQSPKSSAEMEPVMVAMAERYTVIAPDTPGNGSSDAMGLSSVSMNDYGDNIAMLLDVLGIDKVGVYGFHTGACVGGAFASRHPERIQVAILNGFVTLTNDERDDILANYLTPFEPTWDGAHLTWAWSRLREQTVFFPWYRPTMAARSPGDMATTEFVHEGVLEFLRAGDEYRNPYGSAFLFRGDEVAMRMRAPTYIVGSDWDPLSKQLPRLPENLPDCVTVQNLGPGRDTVIPWVMETLAKYVTGPDAPGIVEAKPIAGRSWQDYLPVPGGQLHVRRLDGSGAPIVIQHGAGHDNTVVDRITHSFAGVAPAIAISLPGHGESDNVLGDGGGDIADYANSIGSALQSLGVEGANFVGMGAGALIGLDLSLAKHKSVGKVLAAGLPYHDEAERVDLLANYSEPIVPDWFGGHLSRCWHFVRDQALFWPYYKRTAEGAIWAEPQVEVKALHTKVVALLKSGDMHHRAYQAQFSYPTAEKLAAANGRVQFAAPAWEPLRAHTEAAAKKSGATFADLPDLEADWGRAIQALLGA